MGRRPPPRGIGALVVVAGVGRGSKTREGLVWGFSSGAGVTGAGGAGVRTDRDTRLNGVVGASVVVDRGVVVLRGGIVVLGVVVVVVDVLVVVVVGATVNVVDGEVRWAISSMTS